MKKLFFLKKNSRENMGSTLIEMVVCFALLGIFLAAAAAFITNLTGLYYHIKGETYAREVSDIVLEKVASEIDGAETYTKCGVQDPKFEAAKNTDGTPVLYKDGSTPVMSMNLYDKTDTHVSVLFDPDKERLKIHYYEITGDDPRNATDWYFDDSVYNGFSVKDLVMVRADKLSTVSSGDTGFSLSNYGLSASDTSYPSNVVVVLLHLNHPKYNDYYTYRFIKMYNVPDDYDWGAGTPTP